MATKRTQFRLSSLKRTQFRPSSLLTLVFVAGLVLPIVLWTMKPAASLVTGFPELMGKPHSYIINKLGVPDSETEFTVPTTGTLDEFRIEIHNTYPPGNPKNSNVTIRELYWKDGEYNNTIWLHCPNGTWTVLSTCRWHNKVAF